MQYEFTCAKIKKQEKHYYVFDDRKRCEVWHMSWRDIYIKSIIEIAPREGGHQMGALISSTKVIQFIYKILLLIKVTRAKS